MTIDIPIQDLKDTLTQLAEIRDRIEEKTALERVGAESDVGDRKLIESVNDFDSAWDKGHDRVQENVDTFKEGTQGVIDNFESTDVETVNALEQK